MKVLFKFLPVAIVSILMLFSFSGNCQTCILVKVSKDKIIVGADSRMTRHQIEYDVKSKTSSFKDVIDTVCKINKRGKYYFVVAGSPVQVATGIANQVIDENHSSYLETCKSYGTKIQIALNKYWDSAGKIGERILNEIIGECETTFFGFQDGKPFACLIIMYPVKGQAPNKITFTGQLKDLSDIYRMPIPMGHFDAIKSDILDSTKWNKSSDANFILELLKKQAVSTPKSVAAPFDILEISQKGEVWKSPIRKCKPIVPYKKA